MSTMMQGYVQPSILTTTANVLSMNPTVDQPPFVSSPLLSASPVPTVASPFHCSHTFLGSLSPCTSPFLEEEEEEVTANSLMPATTFSDHHSIHSTTHLFFPPAAAAAAAAASISYGDGPVGSIEDYTSEPSKVHCCPFATPSPLDQGGFGAQLSQLQTPRGHQGLSPSPSLTTMSTGGGDVETMSAHPSYQYYNSSVSPSLPWEPDIGAGGQFSSPSITKNLESPPYHPITPPIPARTTRAVSLAPVCTTVNTSSQSPASSSNCQLGTTSRTLHTVVEGRQRGRKVTQGKSAERPWECSACGVAFQRQEHVTRHYRSRHGGSQCTYSQIFPCYLSLSSIFVNVQEKVRSWVVSLAESFWSTAIPCPHCPYRATRGDNLVSHMASKHGVTPPMSKALKRRRQARAGPKKAVTKRTTKKCK